MGKCGIQLKPDHPALRGLDTIALQFASGDTREVRERIESTCLEAFGRAYQLKPETVRAMQAAGEIEVEQMEDGSVWVSFVADLTLEDAGAALRAMGMLDPPARGFPGDLQAASGAALDRIVGKFNIGRHRGETDSALRLRVRQIMGLR
jgi:hypothetical protein